MCIATCGLTGMRSWDARERASVVLEGTDWEFMDWSKVGLEADWSFIGFENHVKALEALKHIFGKD